MYICSKHKNMNIPITELNNPFAPWHQEGMKECRYCGNNIDEEYCTQSCQDNHYSDAENNLHDLFIQLDYSTESITGIAQLLYNKAIELNFTALAIDMQHAAREHKIILNKQ